MTKILEPLFEPFIHSQLALLTIVISLSTIFVVFTAEFLPKALFRINPNKILNFFAIPFLLVYYLLYPIVFVTIKIAEFLLSKLAGIKITNEEIAFERVDLDSYIKQFTSSGETKNNLDHEITIFKNALDFGSVKLRECMIPRNEIVGIEENEDIKTLEKQFIDTHLSKIVVYRENLDNVIGYVHSNEMFNKPLSIKQILRPIAILPETMAAKDTLTQLKKERKSIAIVVDEFGGTSGLITIEDIIEEIFGEIDDEHDKTEFTEEQISENIFAFSGRIEVDYLNDKYNFNLPVSEVYETLAGLFIHYFSSIPENGQELQIPGFTLKVLKMNGTRIEKIELILTHE
jgi:CBS domain containing-hemolysin-like protein